MIEKFKVQSSKFKVTNVILFAIIVVAVFLRFYSLSSVPPSASLDETSIGWNGYSILKTGGDEYGIKFPLLLRAYDDYRPALYVYLVAPSIQAFGLNVLAVRLPSVILSVLTVIATYFLVKELFSIHLGGVASQHPRGGRLARRSSASPNEAGMDCSGVKRIDLLAFFSAFLLAISPWHIYISRLGHEANLAFAFFIFGVLFFLKKKIPLSFILFAISFASYQAEKIFLPIFLLGLFILFRKELLKLKKKVIISSVIALILLLPFLIQTFQPNALIRFSATSIFSHQSDRYQKEAVLLANAAEENDFIGRIIHNRRILTARIFIEGYLSHFDPKWLFKNPGSDNHKVPGLGLMYLFEAPLILLGIIFLFSRHFSKRVRLILVLWILTSPIPGALATDAPHAMRAYTMLPIPQILASIGAVFVWNALKLFNLLKNKLIIIGSLSLSLFIIAGSIIYMFGQYFVVFPKEQSDSFQYALHGAVRYVYENEEKFEKIIFSNQDNLYQSYMFLLFSTRYDPKLYQKQGGTLSGGFAETHSFGKYEFRPINWSKENKNPSILYVGNPDDFPEDLEGIKTCEYLDGETGVKLIRG